MSEGDQSGARHKLAFGAAPIGNLFQAIDDADAERTIEEAVRQGIRLIDTAPYYGHGLSEARIGRFLDGQIGGLRISTKVGRVLEPCQAGEVPHYGFVDPMPFRAVFDYSERGILGAFESSLARIGVERVDTLLLHDIGRVVHGDGQEQVLRQALEEALPAMRRLQAEGRAARIGLGVNEWEVCAEVLAHQPLDVVLLAGRYTLLEQGAAAFLEQARRAGTRIYAAGVFNSGVLAGGVTYNYETAPAGVTARRDRLQAVCDRFDVPLPAAALQFVAAHPAVSDVVVGMRTPEQVVQVGGWAEQQLPPELWQTLKHEGLLPGDAPVPC